MDWKGILIFTGIGIVVYAGMRYLLPAAVPFLLGWLLASMILPGAKWVEKKFHVRRGVAGGILIGILTAGLSFLIWKLSGLLVWQVGNLLENMGLWAEQAKGFFDDCCCAIETYTGIRADQIREFLIYQAGRIQEQVQKNMGAACVGYLVTMVKGLVALLGGVLVVIIFGTLVIKDMEEFRERMSRGKISSRILAVGRTICAAGGRYLKAQFCIMGIVSLVCMAGFWILKNPYFVIAGLAVGFLDALPLIGAGTILIPWAVLSWIQGEYMLGFGYLVLYLAAYVVRQVLEPRILGKQMGIHPAMMLAAVYGGFFLYGFPGFFLGPVTVLVVRAVWAEVTAFMEEKEKINKKDVKKVQKS